MIEFSVHELKEEYEKSLQLFKLSVTIDDIEDTLFYLSRIEAIKIEGGEDRADIVKHLTSNSIAVMGHIGLMPQYVRSEGGYKVRGKTKEDEEQLIADAIAIEKAGGKAIVIPVVAGKTHKKAPTKRAANHEQVHGR